MLSIGLLINRILHGSPAVSGFVGDRIYPIVTIEDTVFPFLVYERDSVVPKWTKDGRAYDSVSCTVMVFSENYAESARIAESVRTAMEGGDGESMDGFVVECIEMSSASELYSNDTFVQQLTFTMETYKNINNGKG